MTGGVRVHIYPQSQQVLQVVGPTSVEVAHVSRGLRGHPCQSVHGPHKFFKAWLLLRFGFRVTRVQLVRPPPLLLGLFLSFCRHRILVGLANGCVSQGGMISRPSVLELSVL